MKQEKKAEQGSKAARRTAARLAAVQAVYQMRATGQGAEAAVAEYIAHRLGKPLDGQGMVTPDKVLFSSIVQGVGGRMDDLLGVIDFNLTGHNGANPRNSADSVEPLLLGILLCGVYELMAHPQIDAPLVIADYLHVTHAFYEGGESRLVNGILDAAARALRGGEGAAG